MNKNNKKDEAPIDSEKAVLGKKTTALEHLKHLLKIGWKRDSVTIENFLKQNDLSIDMIE